jgi:preprotein translocase subunit SecA
MAGRGTDIKLGEGIAALGGLVILGTERHESRRIDNQLRGRAGRQGDPGESQFFVSMEDDLMRLFGGDRLKTMMERLKVPDDVPLENRLVSRSIEGAQKKVEGHNFDIRRHVVQYDDVMNKHREIIYKRRQKILVKIASADSSDESENFLHEDILTAMRDEASAMVQAHSVDDDSETWDTEAMKKILSGIHPDLMRAFPDEEMRRVRDRDALSAFIGHRLIEIYERKCAELDPEIVRRAERALVLRAIDIHWMDHIDTMAHLREQVAFSGFAQRDPLVEYKDRGFQMFRTLIMTIDATIVRSVFQVDFRQFTPSQVLMEADEALQSTQTNAAQIEGALQTTGASDEAAALREGVPHAARKPQQKTPAHAEKIGRNDPCPCGSGKKYKKCHGKEQ